MTITLDQLTMENTPFTATVNYSQGFPLGVPHGYSWYPGDNGGSDPLPSNFTSMTGWAVVYPEEGQNNSADAAATVQIANADAWVHLKATDQWVQVQDEGLNGIAGAHFIGDFSGATLPMPVTTNADGSVSFGGPPVGYNDHFWFGDRGNYAAGSVDAMYVQMDVRESDPNAHMVFQVGGDWWRDNSAPFLPDFSNNPAAGVTNWVELTTNYQTIGFTSMDMPTFEAHLSNLSGLFDAASPPPPPPPPPPDQGQTFLGTSGSDVLVGTAGNDILKGFGGSDILNGAGGSDSLTGGRSGDTFVFKAGEAAGDTITDFHNNDKLEFYGYGNGSFIQVDATHWAIGYENNSSPSEVIEILGGGALNDYHFIV